MQDRVGQVWEVQMFSTATVGPTPALVLVVASDLVEGMHRLLVVDPGSTSWRQGELKTHGELVEWLGSSGSPGSKRVA